MSARWPLLLAALLLVALPAMGEDTPVLVGQVTKVVDGDTIKVQLSSGPITVRLDSIDTPESNQPYGQKATSALRSLVGGKTVELGVVTQDRYERLVAVVYVDGMNANEWMVRQGHAWAYRQYVKDRNYCVWEGSARANRIGLWSLPVKEWTAPWEWRLAKRGRTTEVTDYSGETEANCITAIGHRPIVSGQDIGRVLR